MTLYNFAPLRTSISLPAGILLAAGIVCAPPLAAQVDACGLVKASDVAVLLGGAATPTPAPKGTTCAWKTTDPKRRLAVLTYSNRAPGEIIFGGARKGAEADAESKIADESGIGDKAFSITPSFGAVFVMMKSGRVLQLQFVTGSRGTATDRSALRVVARKAVAAF